MNLLSHYGKLVYFTFNRFKGDNYTRMREYLAEVFMGEIEQFVSLKGKKVLDVGGAYGEFCRIFEELRPGCSAVNLDLLSPTLPENQWVWKRTIRASAVAMPLADSSFDVVLCRGVIEHVPAPVKEMFLTEMRRVLKDDGVCYIMTQPWWNPNAGHHLKPFHVLPFALAKRLRRLFFGTEIPGGSYAEEHLFPNTFRDMTRMIRKSGMRYVTGLDTHLRLHFMTSVPVLREILVPSVAFICRKNA